MTRKVNATFKGSPFVDVDPDAPTFQRTVENAAGDLSLLYDMMTGENGETSVINHQVVGQGARLGYPYVNQLLCGESGYGFADVSVYNVTDVDGNKEGAAGPTAVLVLPFFAPPLETSLLIRIEGFGLQKYPWRFRITSATDYDTTIVEGPMDVSILRESESGDVTRLHARVDDDDLADGERVLWVIADTAQMPEDSDSVVGVRLTSWTVGPLRKSETTPYVPRKADAASEQVTVTTPSATEGTAWSDFFTALFAAQKPIHSWLLHKINRATNGVLEYLSDWPAHSRSTYTHVDHDSGGVYDAVDPARSRSFAHTRTLYPDEGMLRIPLWAQAFGSSLLTDYAAADKAGTPQKGMIDWHAPYLVDDAGGEFCRARLAFPDLDGTDQDLRAVVIVKLRDALTAGSWSARVTINGAAQTVALTRMATSSHFAYARFGSFAWASDTVQDAIVSLIRTTGSGNPSAHDVALMGACLYFDEV
jgi:hypothetical protein